MGSKEVQFSEMNELTIWWEGGLYVSIVVVVGWECRGYCEENVGVVNIRHGNRHGTN